MKDEATKRKRQIPVANLSETRMEPTSTTESIFLSNKDSKLVI